MDRDERRRMLENKQAFVAALSIAIREFDMTRTGVESIALEVEPSSISDGYMERIRIKFQGGHQLLIPADANSNMANMLAIGRALT
jgi:hypothetical protein